MNAVDPIPRIKARYSSQGPLKHLIFVHGRLDKPTDGVWDYCKHLSEACAQAGVQSEITSVPWDEGIVESLYFLRSRLKQKPRAPGNWVLLQVTALAWSRKGLTIRAVLVALVVRLLAWNLAVIYHDPCWPGSRLRDRFRRTIQRGTFACLNLLGMLTFSTIDLRMQGLGRKRPEKFCLLPVGSNILPVYGNREEDVFTIALFGLSSGLRGEREFRDSIQTALRVASVIDPVRLLALGRGTTSRGKVVEFPGNLRVESHGLVDQDKASYLLAKAHVLLSLRGTVSTRRGSIIAGIAHGLSIVGYGGDDTDWPITEAGVFLVREGDWASAANLIIDLASNHALRQSLSSRSLSAYQRFFSWPAIADDLVQRLTNYEIEKLGQT